MSICLILLKHRLIIYLAQLNTDNTIASYDQVLKLSHYKIPIQVIIKVGNENIQVTTVRLLSITIIGIYIFEFIFFHFLFFNFYLFQCYIIF